VYTDVIDVEQARIAEEAGAVAVMALERIPADIRKDGGVARMSDPEMILEIKKAVSIPVMAKVRVVSTNRCINIQVVGIANAMRAHRTIHSAACRLLCAQL
jgi:pyridoxal 5'-phosphate synthase pdxS subunit